MALLTDAFLRNILTTTKTIAMVGLSMNETRPSYFVGRYLHMRGYKIIPVNAVMEGNISLAKWLCRASKKSMNP